jgi:hypothetical protein
MPSGQQPRPAVRKHLMTPGQPARATRRDPMSLSTVQKWVMSTLVAVTILHFAAGLTVAAVFADRPDARVGLLTISAVMGMLAIVAARLIHQRSPLTPWLLLGLAPAAVGSWWVF